jgi:hypothetical protein
MHTLRVGDKVKYSDTGLEVARNRVSMAFDAKFRDIFRESLRQRMEERGEIVALLHADPVKGSADGYKAIMTREDGTSYETQCLTCYLTRAE